MSKKTDKARVEEIEAALGRVLKHAESHGEVYPGATEDHRTLRDAIGSSEVAEIDVGTETTEG